MFEPKNILVPTDFTDYSDTAVKFALDLARQYGAKVNLLHVIEPVAPCTADYCPDDSAIQTAEHLLMNHAEDKLHAELDKFYDLKGVDVSSDIREGHPGDEILKDQEEKNIDLIVMSPHGKPGVIKRVMGTVSEKVMEEAHCPVLLVRS